jgi:hypothetical protein
MKIYTNELCVFFLTTQHEFQTDELETAIDYYLNSLKTSSCEFRFDLFIFFDQTPTTRSLINLKKYKIHENVNEVYVVSNKIRDDENLYERNLNTDFPIDKLPLGRSHGINHHFYTTLNYLFKTKYKSFLLLESDTKPIKNDWFQNLKKYSECNENYTIAGSLYKGKNYKVHRESYYGGHLNGVGLYRNSEKTKKLLNNSKKYLISELKKDSFFPKSKQKYWEFMNYDVAIYLYAKQNNLLDGYTDTDFFTNASAPTDSDVSLSEILNEYPNTCILHQKKLYGKH